MRITRPLLIACALVSAWTAAPAEAQSPPAAAPAAATDARPLRLGIVERVTVTAPRTDPQPAPSGGMALAAVPRTAAEWLGALPGISPHNAAGRSERSVMVRGFGVRQVPVYVDGIPVYSPYDGGVDLGRYLAGDVAEIQVSRAFTTPLYGANALGGAINVVTREPVKPLAIDAAIGLGSGEAASGQLGVATRWTGGWLAADVAATRRAYQPLAGSARQANSDSRDVNARVKGSTLVGGAELVLGYSIQTAEKGTPAYDGLNAAVQRRYWRWPRWGDRTIFGVASVPISDTLRLRARAYHRGFDNELHAYDDATFTTRQRPSSFTSSYDDETAGGSVEVDVDGLGRHALRAAVSLSASTHREWNLGEPVRVAKGQTWSVGLEDRVVLGARAVALLGVAADGLHVRRADDLRAGAIVAMPSSREASVNPQGALLISPTPSTLVRLTLARRTRLPTVKERYSYRQGRAIPNPALREERARHAEVSATWSAGARVELHVAAFDSAVSDVAERVFLQPNLYQLQNVGGARHRGVETSLRWRPSPSLRAHAGYTLLDRELSNADLKATDTPRHRTLGSIAWTPIAPVTLSADFEHERGRWSQDDTGRYAQASDGTTIALAARVRLPRGAALGVVLRNAGDREYALVEGFPEPGRTIDVELRVRF